MKKHFALVAVFALLASTVAYAQGGGGFGGGGKGGGGQGGGNKGGGGGRVPGGGGNNGGAKDPKAEDQLLSINWNGSVDSAVTSAAGGDKYILLYVYPPSELTDPNAFKVQDVVDASNGNWIFTKKPLNKDDAELKPYKVTSSPTLIGMDKYGNEFKRTTTLSSPAILAILKATPEAVIKFKNELAQKWKDAVAATDEAKALKLLVDICTLGKKGYEEIEKAFEKTNEYGEKRLKTIEALFTTDEAAAAKALDTMAADFKGTPPACDAEIWIAKRERDAKLPSAIARLLKITAILDKHFEDRVKAAQAVLDEIVSDGMARIEAAKQAAAAGEKDAAKKSLSKMTGDYKGTDVAAKATEALKEISK